MAKITKDDQRLLLTQLSDLGYGQSETERREHFTRRLYPVAEHLRAFDPDVVLVVGERGTGKSALFKAVFREGLLGDLARYTPDVRLPEGKQENIHWISGYPIGPNFPDSRGLRSALHTSEQAVELWFAYLVRILKDHLDSEAQKELENFFKPPGGAPDEVLAAFNSAGNAPLLALDRLDQTLQQANEWLFVGYDELDTIGAFHWEVMAQAIKGLIGFWASYARRWQRLRAKIFLRTDLFRRHAGLGGADLAKLAANRAELTWSDLNLFAMLIKRIANTSDALYAYCKGAGISFKQPPDPKLGYIPDLKSPTDARPLIKRIVGEYMGANANKGLSFKWVLDHLRDGHGRVTPRALVRLFEQAAQKERSNPLAEPPKLLRPTSLRQALEDVSADHVTQAIHNEWPWMYGVKERIKEGLSPRERRELEEVLDKDWKRSWGEVKDNIRPPTENPGKLVDYLIELGVVRERPANRVDVPDIYLFGLGLRRKGGVRVK